ncbi:MAG: hypothetical protein KatS3mg051_1461 [Anaerolineae bacterium]|nr:MAG: hypothetical protein KatS3mg051_1461 [Anaerolineae bacterium]
MSEIGAVIMLGPRGKSRAEQLLHRATQAAAADLIETLAQEELAPIVLAAADTPAMQPQSECILDPDVGAFHFGRRLAGLIERYQMTAVMYFGAASAPLLPGSVIGQMRAALEGALRATSEPRLAFTNNLHSSDWVAFTVSKAVIPVLQRVGRDNSLAWLLQQEGGCRVIHPPDMRPAWAFDLDTPADLAIVREHPACPPHLQASCQDSLLDRMPLTALLDTLARDGSRIALIGRVAPQAWAALNEVTQCWLRVFAEERGMVASERLARGEVRSMLARLVDLLGPQGFFDELAGMVDAAIIDSRVLMAAAGHYPAADERFSSDLYLVDTITDEWVRAFTQAAAEAPIPVLLGGHSVVGGGLHVLAELVSKRRAG